MWVEHDEIYDEKFIKVNYFCNINNFFTNSKYFNCEKIN